MGFDGLQFAGRALQAQATALSVTGENLARMNEAGYTRQRYNPQVGPGINPNLPGGQTPQAYSPPFINDTIERLRDRFLDAAVRAQSSVEGYATSTHEMMQRLNTLFDESSTPGLGSAVNKFLAQAQVVAMSPTDIPSRTALLEQAKNVASTFAQRATQLNSLSDEALTRMNNRAAVINSKLQQIADLNQATPAQSTTETNRLLDQRDLLLDDLSKVMNIDIQQQSGGEVIVYQSGVPLVFGRSARSISTSTDALGQVTLVTDNGKVLTNAGGSLGALQDMRNTQIPSQVTQLDALAASFKDEVNNRLSNGTDLNGAAGTALFGGITAASMAVTITDPKALGLATSSVLSKAGINGAGVLVSQGASLASQPTGFNIAPSAPTGVISVNGTQVAWSTGETLDQILSSLSVAGVKASFDAPSQKVLLQRDPSIGKATPGITIVDVTGNLGDVLGLNGATVSNGIPGDGSGAQSLANLRTTTLSNNLTMPQSFQKYSTTVATQTSYWNDAMTAASKVNGSLNDQRQQVMGVNSDEEATNLMQYQRGYEAAIRLATAQDEILQSIINSMGAH